MKIKYRKFDDFDETEVEVKYFKFRKMLSAEKPETELEWIDEYNEFHSVLHVCEVSMEEI